MTPEERFFAKVDAQPNDGCWLWTGAKNRKGYGRFWFQGRKVAAHRFAYRMLVGPIPEGLQLDHLCRVRHCVNPAHLEAVTNRVNVLRGDGPAARAARATHCPAGHDYDVVDSRGWRSCAACRREQNRERQRRHRARRRQAA